MFETAVSPPPPPEQKQKKNTLRIAAIAIIVTLAAVFLGSFLYVQFGQQREYELTIVRATVIVNVHTSLGSTNVTNAVVQDKVAGKYPIGRYLEISFPSYNSLYTIYGTGTLKLVRVESQTQGFTFEYSDPPLPAIVPNSGSVILKLNFATPTTPYKGPLDYTLYYNYQATAEGIELINGTYDVHLMSIRYVRIYIDASGKTGNNVSGSVTTNGQELNFYVFDEDGYNLWNTFQAVDQSGWPFGGIYPTKEEYYKENFHVYVFAERSNSYEYSFAPSQTDHYYFVFDNHWINDMGTNKAVQVTATWTYAGIP